MVEPEPIVPLLTDNGAAPEEKSVLPYWASSYAEAKGGRTKQNSRERIARNGNGTR